MAIRSSVEESKGRRGAFFQIGTFGDFSYYSYRVMTGGVVCFIVASLFTVSVIVGSFMVFQVVYGARRLILRFSKVNLTFNVLYGLSNGFSYLYGTFKEVGSHELVRVVPRAFCSLFGRGAVFIPRPFSNFQVRRVQGVNVSQPCDYGGVASIFSLTRVIIFSAFLMGLVSQLGLRANVGSQGRTGVLIVRFLRGF